MRRAFAMGLSLLGVAAAGIGIAAAPAVGHAAETNVGLDGLDNRRGKGQRNRRGKHAPRRHGAKLRSNRLHVSKRARGKHRKAAKR